MKKNFFDDLSQDRGLQRVCQDDVLGCSMHKKPKLLTYFPL